MKAVKSSDQFHHNNKLPDWVETAPMAAGQSALWKYKAIYQRVDQWSDVASIPVAG